MKTSTFGVILASVSVGVLAYLYFGYYKPRQEAYEDAVREFQKK